MPNFEKIPGQQEGGSHEKEKGKEVKITLVVIRHGQRGLDGSLTDQGREEARKVAQEVLKNTLKDKEYDIVKPYGSSAGPHVGIAEKNVTGTREVDMGRSLETANILAEEISSSTQTPKYNARGVDSVNYTKFAHKPPYNHTEIYNSFIPDNYDELSDEEKAKASKYAQQKTIEHLMNLDSPEALEYKKEVAGGYALPLVHFAKMSERIESGKEILIPLGVHGGHMELLLQQAMVRKDKDGKEVIGFNKLDEIGGEMNTSDGYIVKIKRDSQGKLSDKYKMIFIDQENRPQGTIFLDRKKIEKLAEYYKKLHPESRGLKS